MAYMDVQAIQSHNGRTVSTYCMAKTSAAPTGTALAAILSRNKGYRVIMPDQIGFGKSSKPASFNTPFNYWRRTPKPCWIPSKIKKVADAGPFHGRYACGEARTDVSGELRKNWSWKIPSGWKTGKLKVPYQSIDQWRKENWLQN